MSHIYGFYTSCGTLVNHSVAESGSCVTPGWVDGWTEENLHLTPYKRAYYKPKSRWNKKECIKGPMLIPDSKRVTYYILTHEVTVEICHRRIISYRKCIEKYRLEAKVL